MSAPRFLILVLLALACVGVVFAIDDATLRFAEVEGAGFRARDVVAQLEITDTGLRVRAQVGEITLLAGESTLRDVQVSCPALELSIERMACANAELTGTWPVLGRQTLRAGVSYGRVDGSLRVSLDDVRIGPGRAAIRLALSSGRWSGSTRLQQVAIEELVKLARALQVELPPIGVTGIAQVDVRADGTSTAEFGLSNLSVAGELRELTLNNESGSLASDKLQLGVDATMRKTRDDWRVQVKLSSNAGQAYVQPMFVDFGAHPIELTAQGVWTQRVLQVEHFDVRHTDVLDANGMLEFEFGAEQPLRALDVRIASLQFPGAYESYLQPFMLDTSFKAMKSSGAIRGQVRVAEGKPQRADLEFHGLTMDDGARTLVLRDLDGHWHWRNQTEPSTEETFRTEDVQPSELKWASGVLLGLELGAAAFKFSTTNMNFRLLEPARIPVFDGSIDLESFRVRNAGTPKVAFIVDATIRPISVSQLCKAFGWPEFGGQISGAISKLRLRDGVVTLGTTLQAQVFDGQVRLSDLRLEDALGQWPRFYANVALDNLDLDLVTSAFSFGRITGRLSGAVKELRLFNWMPVSFDASLYTPVNDRSRHRISQRAVANIGNLGGGGASVTAALSSGFLKFFEDFNYDRLGLSCRLQNEVCYMNGVAPAPNNGYYLVKGRGIPRIEVIAGARRVDWPRMVAQLKAATESKGPIVR
jgi:hypothetical protein